MTDIGPAVPPRDTDEAFDLAERLASYRARLAREGRKSALDRLDRAINQSKRQPPTT